MHPAQRLAHAQALLERGERTAAILHQAASGLASSQDQGALSQLLPACLGAYGDEIEGTPDDPHLRLGFAKLPFGPEACLGELGALAALGLLGPLSRRREEDLADRVLEGLASGLEGVGVCSAAELVGRS